ncbi:putative ABC transport system permease protein [Micromonospora phaseoli]|uniref:Putative ABC transport system permease protein n=1 Tax=Micromonospora phaseoli TaxID=1144548 RepID=A0A1H6YRB7_9ACTN|nr:hypothetical protein [Micromonospora phaseoli]PZW00356.1 hypothetical protein CLV64_103384 [Micromonospora phaseoli]GIJ76834.1 hypothetical protein Xph01_12660 [Micromonospora phaseoli]SEJ43858.1 putative ABC transport system permease protein [Micromonospora phaseoli]
MTLGGQPFEVAAVVVGTGSGGVDGPLPADHVVELVDADFTRLFPDERGQLAEIDPADGVSAAAARTAIEEVLVDYPTVNLMDQAAYKRMLTGTVDMLLAFVVALLGLAVLTALVGAVLGVALGTAVTAGAMALLARLAGDFTLVVPWAQLGGVLAVAVLAALAASVLPARRALALPVVEALADQ